MGSSGQAASLLSEWWRSKPSRARRKRGEGGRRGEDNMQEWHDMSKSSVS